MKICLITPYKNLKESELGDAFYALTRELHENQTYYEFFKDKKKQGYDVTVDNNVHEGTEIDFEDHIKLTLEVGTICVVPDVLRDKKKTLEYFHYFMDKFYPILLENKIKILAVPQGRTLEEIRECLIEMSEDSRVDIIGNSFDLEPFKIVDGKYENQTLNRRLVVSMFLENTQKPIHLLGSNGLGELYVWSRYSQIVSTDGKLFSRLALGGVDITENWKSILKPGVKMGFKDVFTRDQSKLFTKNVNFFKRVLDGRDF